MDEKLVTLLITIFTAIAYLSGYGFLYGYYQYFDVGVWELNLSIQDILVHASSAFVMTLTQFDWLLLVALIVTLMFRLRLYGKRFNIKQIQLTLLPCIFLFLSISLSYSVSYGREKASEELRLLNPFVASGLSEEVLRQSPMQSQSLKLLHLATTVDTFFVVGIHQTGRDRWVGRISRENNLASFVYQDP